MGRSYGRTWKQSGGHIKECGLDSIHIRNDMWKRGEGYTVHHPSGPAARCCRLSSGDQASHSCSSDVLSYALGRARKIGSGSMSSSRQLVFGRAQQLALCKVGMGRGPRICLRRHATDSGDGAAGPGSESKGTGVLHAGRLWHGKYFVDSCCSNTSSCCWAEWD